MEGKQWPHMLCSGYMACRQLADIVKPVQATLLHEQSSWLTQSARPCIAHALRYAMLRYAGATLLELLLLRGPAAAAAAASARPPPKHSIERSHQPKVLSGCFWGTDGGKSVGAVGISVVAVGVGGEG
eukprot:scaffold75415_cov21-Tisochrysis_lutea.AAC.2